eukprot:COSAG02_NODE_65509_length_258_cov_0.534591_1_plen_36_part_10
MLKIQSAPLRKLWDDDADSSRMWLPRESRLVSTIEF